MPFDLLFDSFYIFYILDPAQGFEAILDSFQAPAGCWQSNEKSFRMADNNTTTLILLNEIAGCRELTKAIKAFCDAVIKGRVQIVLKDEVDLTRSKYTAETYLS